MNAEFISKLPNYFRPNEGEAVPVGLVGGTITFFGTFAEAQATEGGGLVIEYVAKPSGEHRRLVFSFNECGMWVSDKQTLSATRDALAG